MKRILTAAFVLFVLSVCSYGADNKPNLLKNAAVLLPPASKVKFNWIIPPAESKNTGAGLIFKMDGSGNLWLGRGGKYVLNPNKNYMFGIDQQYDDFMLTAKGALYFAAKGYIGYIPPVKEKGTDTGIHPFQPIAKLPVNECRLFAGTGSVIYITGKNPANGRYEVFTASGEGASDDKMKMVYKKLFSAANKISAAAGDGKITFIAMDKLVVSSVTGLDKTEGVFKHSKEAVTGLAYDVNAGLFYCTAKGVGYAGKNNSTEFLAVSNPSIAVSGGKLYIYIPEETAVLQVDNISDFKGYARK
ncbi:MAG: hypothetical protein JXR81_05380 [Candidatus Goldbacteria bacterium]|nr:hypothetical protein [Candidatus Goldiibacteriota bacterium]